MSHIIEIKDQAPPGYLSIELSDILNILVPEGAGLTWAILDLEATVKPETGRNVLALEQQIQESTSGIILTWDDLVSLSREFLQVINTIIVGCRDAADIAPLQSVTDLYSSSEIVVEMIDSSAWRIYARDAATMRKLRGSFRNVEDIN
jgi:hypothetical protein